MPLFKGGTSYKHVMILPIFFFSMTKRWKNVPLQKQKNLVKNWQITSWKKKCIFKIKINSPSSDGELSFRTSTPNILRNFV